MRFASSKFAAGATLLTAWAGLAAGRALRVMPRSVAFDYNNNKVYGVNAGGWL